MEFLVRKAKKYLEKKGYGVIHPSQYRSDMESEFFRIWEKVENKTMISVERGYNIFRSVQYICRNKIEGDFVECGVWKGGSCMLMALALMQIGETGRKIILYDTFTGMTRPAEEDKIAWTGLPVLKRWEENYRKDGKNMWAISYEETRSNMLSTGYPENMMEFCAGDVCKVLDKKVPEKISLLRLDTDWYESTKKELEILYPQLLTGGVLIIDDYGHFTGSKKAVDEYFSGSSQYFPMLERIDYTGRSGIKI